MSLTPAVIDALVAAGATVEMLAAAVKADMAEADARLAEKRAKDAARQRKHRGTDVVSRDVTVTVCDIADVTESPLSRPPNDNNSNPPTHTHENINTRETGNPFPRPDGVDPALWADFRANRKAKKLTNTASAYSKFQRDLAAECARTGWPPGEVLRACVERGWGGIYKITEQNNGQSKSNNRGGSTRDAAQLALARMGHA